MSDAAGVRQAGVVVACTLADNDYLLGAGVLVNSLIHHGFKGPIFVGYRGALPEWAGGKNTIKLDDDTVLNFVLIQSTRLLNFEKPGFILKVFEMVPNMAGIIFFDSDIVVTSPWFLFEDWLEQGVGVCQDASYPWISPLHPWRLHWAKTAKELGGSWRSLDVYFNSGFVSVPKEHLGLIRAWRATIDHLWPVDGLVNGSANALTIGHRSNAFHATDQDALSIAAMMSDVPLAVVGPDAMGFAPGAFIMLHAIGPKPWRQHYLRAALAGIRPGSVDKAFWQQTVAPFRVFGNTRQRWSKLTMTIASAIGRFYHRG